MSRQHQQPGQVRLQLLTTYRLHALGVTLVPIRRCHYKCLEHQVGAGMCLPGFEDFYICYLSLDRKMVPQPLFIHVLGDVFHAQPGGGGLFGHKGHWLLFYIVLLLVTWWSLCKHGHCTTQRCLALRGKKHDTSCCCCWALDLPVRFATAPQTPYITFSLNEHQHIKGGAAALQATRLTHVK